MSTLTSPETKPLALSREDWQHLYTIDPSAAERLLAVHRKLACVAQDPNNRLPQRTEAAALEIESLKKQLGTELRTARRRLGLSVPEAVEAAPEPPAGFADDAEVRGFLGLAASRSLPRAADPATTAAVEPIRLTASATIDLEAKAGGPTKLPAVTILAYTGGELRIGWSRPLVLDLAGIVLGRVALLWNHEPAEIVGQGEAIWQRPDKLIVVGRLTGRTDDGGRTAEIISHAKNGFVWAASVGVGVHRLEPIGDGQRVVVNGRGFTGPIHVVRAGRLGEVSFVGVGADEQATAVVDAAAGGAS